MLLKYTVCCHVKFRLKGQSVQELMVENRQLEASVVALTRQIENERMALADMEAQANHELMRHRDLVKAYHPLVQRCRHAEAADKVGRSHIEELTNEIRDFQDQCSDLQQQLSTSAEEISQLKEVQKEHELLLLDNKALQDEYLEVSICLKRCWGYPPQVYCYGVQHVSKRHGNF